MKTKFFTLALVLFAFTINTEAKNIANAQLENPKITAATLVQRSLKSVHKNYSKEDNQMNAFYKERVIKNNEALSINEAILDINKASYISPKKDMVAVRDIRGNANNAEFDSLMIKLQGGPVTALQLDVIKYPFLGSEIHNLTNYYDFDYSTPQELNGKMFYVVNFNQKYSNGEMLFRGKIFIEPVSLAIAKVEYSMNVERRGYAYEKFMKRKPKDCDVHMISASYVVNYKQYNNKWYFDYSTSDISFYLSKDSKSVPNVYTVSSQMAVTNLLADGIHIDKKEMLKSTDILSDMVKDFKVASDWDIYNLIMLLAINY